MNKTTLVNLVASVLPVGSQTEIVTALNVKGTFVQWSRERLKVAKTTSRCMAIFRHLRGQIEINRDSYITLLILRKALRLAKNDKDLMSIFGLAPEGSDIKKRVVKKIVKILQAKLKFAKSSFACLLIYLDSPRGTFIEKRALKKAFKLAKTKEDFLRIFERVSRHSVEAYTCIRKIAEIIKREKKSRVS